MDHRDLDSVVAHASWMISSNSAGTLYYPLKSLAR
jgi:hypothetical protein